MFIIKEILMPRSSRSNLAPIAIDTLEASFEDTITRALFAFHYSPDHFQYVINVQIENGIDDFLLIVDPELMPIEGQLFVSVIENVPVVRKYNESIHSGLKILGTIAHASKAASVFID